MENCKKCGAIQSADKKILHLEGCPTWAEEEWQRGYSDGLTKKVSDKHVTKSYEVGRIRGDMERFVYNNISR